MSMYQELKTRRISDADLTSILTNVKLNNRGQYICDCPFCGKERHFYISQKTQLWDCKKCGEYGNIGKLLRKLQKNYLLEGSTIEVRDNINSIRRMNEDSIETSLIEELPVVKMPIGWRVRCNSYLLSRGLDSEDCVRYNIGYTELMSKYSNYILIPVYDNGEIKGYVGRFASKCVPDGVLRYKNSPGTKFSDLLFGYDEINDQTTSVIIVEGIFDKIAVDKTLGLWDSDYVKCVCTFGKKISDVQIKKLCDKGVVRVVLLYDFDAIKDIKRYGLKLENYFVTRITYTTKKDIDECTRDEALSVFDNLYKPSEFNIDIVGKIKRK